LPLLSSVASQLESFSLYPGAYGATFWIALLAVIIVAGLVVVQLEKSAEKAGRRQDAVTRLNVGLAGMVTLAMAGSFMTFLSSYGWAAAAASVSFFVATFLVIPAGRLPGSRAMACQPERAWALLAVISVVALAVAPSLPGLGVVGVCLAQVRRRWAGISRGDDLHQDGPVDGTNRLSAVLLTVFVLLASAIGMQAMTLSPQDLRAADVEATPAVPGTVKGPTIGPPTP
ncbi:MAG: hypothetical protein JHD16_18570, partial [Solirubrobacteraceae bacterium]|nr:hypothetical protein [Solirubrobacteraceae bacterium]